MLKSVLVAAVQVTTQATLKEREREVLDIGKADNHHDAGCVCVCLSDVEQMGASDLIRD